MKSNKGFTLIEIIITIVALAIAATMMATIFSEQFRGGALSANQVQSQYRMIQQMELFTSQYRNQITNDTAFSLSTFKTQFIDGKDFVDGSRTTDKVTFNYGTRTTKEYLRVTLTDGDQTLMTIFTD